VGQLLRCGTGVTHTNVHVVVVSKVEETVFSLEPAPILFAQDVANYLLQLN
jgi:hypothetical protein